MAVEEYIDTKKTGSDFGFYCSPLLTRTKNDNKLRDNLDENLLDTTDFLLKCPETCIYKLIKMLSITRENFVLLEIDVSKVKPMHLSLA